MSNEKSTNEITLLFNNGLADFGNNPTILGCCTIENNLILFVTQDVNKDDPDKDTIYKLTINAENLEAEVETVKSVVSMFARWVAELN